MSTQLPPPPTNVTNTREMYTWLYRLYAYVTGEVGGQVMDGEALIAVGASTQAAVAEQQKLLQGIPLLTPPTGGGEFDKALQGSLLLAPPPTAVAGRQIQDAQLLTAPRGALPSTLSVRSVTAAANLLPTEFMDVDATGGAVTITLPPAAGNAGKMCGVAKNDASANAVTLSGQLNGVASTDITVQYTALLMVSTGSEWRAW